jgi:hypothetical protein
VKFAKNEREKFIKFHVALITEGNPKREMIPDGYNAHTDFPSFSTLYIAGIFLNFMF